MGRPSSYKNNDPSVTQIINLIDKPGLTRWYAKHGWDECERIKTEAGMFGSCVHDALERFLKGASFSECAVGLSDVQVQALSKFTSWAKEEGIKPVELELTLHSERYSFGGTFDGLFTKKRSKKLWLGDWKTGSWKPKDHKYQLGGYSVLTLDVLGKDVSLGFIKRVGRDLTTNYLETDELPIFREKFLRLREAFRDWYGR